MSLFKALEELGADSEAYVLAAIVLGQQSEEATEAEHRQDDWYWRRRTSLQAQIQAIVDDDLVRVGPDLDSVVFYESHEVDCPHGRRRKHCVKIFDKLELLTQLRNLLRRLETVSQSCPDKSAARHIRSPLHRRIRNRVAEIETEIKALDSRVDPATAESANFCANVLKPRVAEAVDERPPKRSGAPPKRVQNYLLETIVLHSEPSISHPGHASQRQACQLVAKILLYCFDEPPQELSQAVGESDDAFRDRRKCKLDDVIDDRTDALARQLRVLRQKKDQSTSGAREQSD
jgi:hypothetical protein